MLTVIRAVLSFLRTLVVPKTALALEVAALRQQLGVFQRQCKRPQLTRTDRAFCIVLRRLWSGWSGALIIVKPKTVIGWCNQSFRALWRVSSCRSNLADVRAQPRQ